VAALTHDIAIARAALLEVHDLDLDLDVTGADGFTSRTRIRFGSRTEGRTFMDVAPRLAWCEGFWYAEQSELCSPYAQRYFTDIPSTAPLRAGPVSSMVALLAFPRYHVSAETERVATQALEGSDLSTGVRRSIGDRTDDLRRALAVRGHA
jgi:hypothetical protein